MPALFLVLLSLFFGSGLVRASGGDASAFVDLAMLEKSVALFDEPGKTSSEKTETVNAVLALLAKSSDFQYKQYWNSVFQTFQCELNDRGRIIPFCILKHLDSIKEGLHFAHQTYPEHYHYAPARTLAIMYFKMPGFVGGSHKKAKEYILEAFRGAPEFPENKKWHSRITGKN